MTSTLGWADAADVDAKRARLGRARGSADAMLSCTLGFDGKGFVLLALWEGC
jgi:hypothetical protein